MPFVYVFIFLSFSIIKISVSETYAIMKRENAWCGSHESCRLHSDKCMKITYTLDVRYILAKLIRLIL